MGYADSQVVFNGILKLMPTSNLDGKRLVANRKFTIHFWRGFTLIEMLVVITLFGIVSTLVTASYITFERNQRIRNATQTLKNDLRFVQNKALAGGKGANSECSINDTLAGWYVTFNITVSTSSYTYAGVCRDEFDAETPFPSPTKTVTFPSGVTLNSVKLGVDTLNSGDITILFKPLVTDVALHSSSGPPFNSGNAKDFTGDLVIELKGQQTSNVSTVTVRPTGEISGGQ